MRVTLLLTPQYLLFVLVSMTTLILHLNHHLLQFLLRTTDDFVGCCSLPGCLTTEKAVYPTLCTKKGLNISPGTHQHHKCLQMKVKTENLSMLHHSDGCKMSSVTSCENSCEFGLLLCLLLQLVLQLQDLGLQGSYGSLKH